jgi:hypothetical protein
MDEGGRDEKWGRNRNSIPCCILYSMFRGYRIERVLTMVCDRITGVMDFVHYPEFYKLENTIFWKPQL